MKNLKKLSLLGALTALGFYAVNAMEDFEKTNVGDFETVRSGGGDNAPKEIKKLVNLINDFNSEATNLSEYLKQKGPRTPRTKVLIYGKFNNIIEQIKKVPGMSEKLEGYNVTPIQLAKFYADKYKKKAWNELTFAQKAKWAGLFYWDEVTVMWDKFIQQLKDVENEDYSTNYISF